MPALHDTRGTSFMPRSRRQQATPLRSIGSCRRPVHVNPAARAALIWSSKVKFFAALAAKEHGLRASYYNCEDALRALAGRGNHQRPRRALQRAGERIAMHACRSSAAIPSRAGWSRMRWRSGTRRSTRPRRCWSAAHRAARHRRHRHHQPARDHGRLGPQHGRPVAPAIVWQCRRTADFCAELARSPTPARITNKTGLVIDAYFSGSKIRWILENVPGRAAEARDGELLFGNIDTWLIWKLTDGARARHGLHQRVAHHADGPGDRRVGRRAAADLRHSARHAAEDRAVLRRGRQSSPRSISAPRSRSRASRAISRRRSPARPASAPGFRRTPTAPAVSP